MIEAILEVDLRVDITNVLSGNDYSASSQSAPRPGLPL